MAWWCQAEHWYLLLSRQIAQLDRKLDAVLFRLSQPGPLRIRVTGERDMSLVFEVVLSPPGAADVVSREFTLTVDGTTFEPQFAPGDTLVIPNNVCPDGATVTAQLVDIDDAGNRSIPRLLTAVITDTIAPPQPGEMGFRVTGET